MEDSNPRHCNPKHINQKSCLMFVGIIAIFWAAVLLVLCLAGCVTVSVHQQTGDEALRATQLQTTKQLTEQSIKQSVATSETHFNKQPSIVGYLFRKHGESDNAKQQDRTTEGTSSDASSTIH